MLNSWHDWLNLVALALLLFCCGYWITRLVNDRTFRTKYNLVSLFFFSFLLVDSLLVFFAPAAAPISKLLDKLDQPYRTVVLIIGYLLMTEVIFFQEIKWWLNIKTNNYAAIERDAENILKHSTPTPERLLGYSDFLWAQKQDYDKAEQYFKQALKQFPENAKILSHYARFLVDIRKDYAQAEKFYTKAVGLDAANTVYLRKLAHFLAWIRPNYNEAERFFLKLIEIEPQNAINLYYYACFLSEVRKEYDKAEEYFSKAIELDPNDSDICSTYASFLAYTRKDYDNAEHFFKKAVRLDNKNAEKLEEYAFFLNDVKKDPKEAESQYKKLLKLDKPDARLLANYAKFLILIDDMTKAKLMIGRAFDLNKEGKDQVAELELWFYCYAVFHKEFPESESAINSLLAQGIRSPGWNLKDVLELAKEKGHLDYEKLAQFESAITEGEK